MVDAATQTLEVEPMDIDTDGDDAPAAKTFGERVRDELRFFVGLVAVMLVLFTLVFGHFKIPSESMQPTLEVGDHLYASKHPYGYSNNSLPFGLHRLPLPEFHINPTIPERGDVVVFRNPNPSSGHIVMIKRVVGLPGDVVETVNGRLVLNGTVVPRTLAEKAMYREFRADPLSGTRPVVGVNVYEEQLPGEDEPHLIFERSDGRPLDNSGPFTVGEGEVFFMGDNRDNSEDSRSLKRDAPGFVPLDHLIARAEVMMFSLNRCKTEDNLRCPGRRWFRGL